MTTMRPLQMAGVTSMVIGGAFVAILGTLQAASWKPPRPQAPEELSRLERMLVHPRSLEADDLLIRRLGPVGQELRARGRLSEFQDVQVPVGPNTTESLGTIARSVFAEQYEFEREIARLPSAEAEEVDSIVNEQRPFAGPPPVHTRVLFGSKRVIEEAYETDDFWLLTRSIKVVVANPDELARRSSVFRSFLARRGSRARGGASSPREFDSFSGGATPIENRHPLTIDRGVLASGTLASLRQAGTMSVEQRERLRQRGGEVPTQQEQRRQYEQGLREYMDDAAQLADGHPLKSYAMRRDEDGLLAAIAEGKGEFEIVDTVTLPKSRPSVRLGARPQLDVPTGLISGPPRRRELRSNQLALTDRISVSNLDARNLDTRQPFRPSAAARTGAGASTPIGELPEYVALKLARRPAAGVLQVQPNLAIGNRLGASEQGPSTSEADEHPGKALYGRFVGSNNRQRTMTVRASEIGSSETFRVVRRGNDRVSLQSFHNRGYLGVTGTDGRLFVARNQSEELTAAEIFRLVPAPHDQGAATAFQKPAVELYSPAYFLASLQTGKYLRVDRDTRILTADAEDEGAADTFRLVASTFRPRMTVVTAEGQGARRPIPRVRVTVTPESGGGVRRIETADDGTGPLTGQLGQTYRLTPHRDRYVFVPPFRDVTFAVPYRIQKLNAVSRTSTSGVGTFNAEFLTGFTEGHEWEWERRWRYPSGFFRITLGAGYGLGLRVPIRIKGDVSPLHIYAFYPRELESPVFRLQARTLNAGAAFYRRAGLSRSQVFDGQELVLGAHLLFGMKFRALWTDVIHFPNDTYGFDYSRDFLPPLSEPNNTGLTFAIPCQFTNTCFELGVVSGRAEAGLQISGDGTVEMDCVPFTTAAGGRNRRSGRPLGLLFENSDQRSNCSSIPGPEEAAGEENFGLRLSNPRYQLDVSVTPGLRVAIDVGYGSVSRGFSTGWIWLNPFRLDLFRIELGRHDGTRSSYEFARGRRKWGELERAGRR